LQRLLYPGLIALGVIVIFWKITLSGQFTWMNGDDIVQQVLPWFQMQAREWHRGNFPLLDPYHWGGQSLAGQAQPGAMYPLNWLLFALPMTHGRLQVPILNGYFVFIHILGAWAMYGLLRSLGIVGAIAAVIGIAFGAGGYMATVDWPQMLNGAVWLPVAVLFWVRFLRAPGRYVWAALAGAAGGVSVLSGHHSGPIMILTSIAGLTAWMLFERRWTRRRLACYAIGLAAFGLFFFLLSAVQSLPATEYWRVAYRFVGTKSPVTFDQQIPYQVHRHFSFDAASLPGLVVNGYFREAALNPFLGVVLTALAGIGFAEYRQRLAARLFLFLGVSSLLLALGENSLLHGVFYAWFPLFDKLRNPSMIILCVHFSLLVLAAFGLDAVRRGLFERRWGVWLARVGGGALAMVFVLYALDPAKAASQQGAAQSALIAAALGMILLAPMAGRTRAVLAGALILVEIGGNTTKSYPDKEMGFATYDRLRKYDDIAGFLAEQRKAGPFRFTVDEGLGLQCFGAWYGLEQANGCFSMSINMFREFWRPEVQPLVGVRYHVGPEAKTPDQVKRFTGQSGFHVWESPVYAPWAWTAHRFQVVTEGEFAGHYLRGWPAVKEPLVALSGSAKTAICEGADTVRLTDLRNEYGRVEASMACDGLLVYSSAAMPGWVATVDGREVPIIEAYGKLMAVSVPAGAHAVEFRYAPSPVRVGALLTLVGLLAAAGWWWLSGRRGSGFRGLRRPAVT